MAKKHCQRSWVSIHAIDASWSVVTTKTGCIVQLHWERKDYTRREKDAFRRARKRRMQLSSTDGHISAQWLLIMDTIAYSSISRDLGSLKLFRTRKIIQFNDWHRDTVWCSPCMWLCDILYKRLRNTLTYLLTYIGYNTYIFRLLFSISLYGNQLLNNRNNVKINRRE